MYPSKYFNKTHEKRIYLLDEYNCPHCGHWFMIDISFCKAAPTADYDDYVKVFCPYCGKSHLRVV